MTPPTNGHLPPDGPRGSVDTTLPTTINAETASRHRRKYETRNPLQRRLLRRYFRVVRSMLDKADARRVLDFGCGEGYFWKELNELMPLPEVVGLDLREDAVELARRSLPHLTFHLGDILTYDGGGPVRPRRVCRDARTPLRPEPVPGPAVRDG